MEKINLELVSFYIHTSRVSAKLTEKRKELTDLKSDYDRKKSKADEETSALKYKENQLSIMKSNLKDEESKFETTRKQNLKLTEDLQTFYKHHLLLTESIGDESLKEKLLQGMVKKFTPVQ